MTTKSILVTGATGRIGHAIVEKLTAQGAKAVATDHDGERLQAAFGERDNVTTIVADLTSEEDLKRLAAEAIAAAGQIDALVNCAGIFPNRQVINMSTDEWDLVYSINLRGPFILSREIARHMVEREVRGSIVNISSGAGTSARTGGSHYCGSKAALEMLTKVLAIELGPYGIRVNAVAPGLILDEVLAQPVPEGTHEYVTTLLNGIPLRRTGRPEDIANTVAFLCGDETEWVSGAVWGVNGGSQAGRTHLPPSE